MTNYIIQVVLFQFLFLVIYDLLLRKETFFNWNRAYLLAAPILSFVIPLIKIDFFAKVSQATFVENLPLIILNPQAQIISKVSTPFTVYVIWILIIGMLLMLSLFLFKLASLLILKHKSVIVKSSTHTMIVIDKPGVVFSFFKSIFIDKSILQQPHQHIVNHELVHISDYHSLDLLLFETLKILTWFNPMVYLYQNRITELHEFIADSKTILPQNKNSFFNSLLATSFKVTNVDFINQFYKHSLLKKRIMMTNKNKSKQMLKLKYLLLIPILGSMLFYVSCQQKQQSISEQVSTLKASLAKKDSLNPKENKEVIGLVSDIIKIQVKNTENYKIYNDSTTVPFAIVDKVPIYPGCEDAENQKKCLSDHITSFVNKNFDVSLAKSLNLTPGLKRIFVLFKIDQTGKIADVKAKAPDPQLEDEAIRVINLIPQMKPGIHQGKTVSVKYSLPIVFNVSQ